MGAHLIPTRNKGLLHYLPLLEWCSVFWGLPNFTCGTLVRLPLTDLTSTNKLLRWSSQAQNAFYSLKSWFISAPILTTPDPARQFRGASEVGWGIVVSEIKIHPCTFFSYRLTPTESNYDIGNGELLTVKLVLAEWHHWLEGAEFPFIIWTDHKNLEYIRTTKSINSRQARWALFFRHFRFTISYRPDSENGKPDALSRIFEGEAFPTLWLFCIPNGLWGLSPGGWSPRTAWRYAMLLFQWGAQRVSCSSPSQSKLASYSGATLQA